MTSALLHVAGGLGLFLLGMVVMTTGLRALAGESLNRALLRFTRSPTTGAATGAAVTAVVQSSSATTVATVGFVSAGVLGFDQALGILFGANIGTTVTGWLVALFGIKLALGTLMLPALLAGMLLYLFTRGRSRDAGWALAGFALIFLGIEQLQAGMGPLSDVVTPASFPGDGWGGRLLLVALGAAITLVTQSSSAGVAMALTAVAAGAIAFPQAAALVIGMDVGTTVTAALATVGATAAGRRTGFAHVVYNLMTAVLALLLLEPYVAALAALAPGGAAAQPELALVGFHTTFNTLGVLAVLPFTRAFARLMTRLVPERGSDLTRRLDPLLLKDANAAALALSRTARDLTRGVFTQLGAALTPGSAPRRDTAARGGDPRLDALESAVDEARAFAEHTPPCAEGSESQRRLVSAFHVLDHLDRLVDRCRQSERPRAVRADERLAPLGAALRTALIDVAAGLDDDGAPPPEAPLKAIRDLLKDERAPFRAGTISRVGHGLPLSHAIARLDAVRWLHRCAYHAWRIAVHLQPAAPATEAAAPPAPGDAIAPRAESGSSELE